MSRAILYMTRDELSELLGCAPTSYKTMSRRLTALAIPHLSIPGCCPRVLRVVHNQLLTACGGISASARFKQPNFKALE